MLTSTRENEAKKMKNIEVMNRATEIMGEWDGAGFFLSFYVEKTGNYFGTDEYTLVQDMLMGGLL